MNPDRRTFLADAAAVLVAGLVPAAPQGSQAAARGRDVSWLRDVLRAPANAPPPPPLAPVLVDGDGRAIRTLDVWQVRREQLAQRWREFLGPLEVARGAAPPLEVLEEDTTGNVLRQRVRYAIEPGVTTEAYLLRPRLAGARRPAAVVLHSTVADSIRQPAGLAGAPEKHFGLALAERGFVTLCPRNYLWPENGRIAAEEEARRFHLRHPRAKGMARMLFDAQVAVDILAARPEVDPARIGCIGHSLGAKEVLYLAALDTRIRAAVASEGGVGMTQSNWDADWYLGDSIAQPGLARGHHELLALAAPRPFLIVGGDSADGVASWPYVAAALPAWRLYGEPVRLGLLNHGRGHAVPPDVVPRMLEWLEAYVAGGDRNE